MKLYLSPIEILKPSFKISEVLSTVAGFRGIDHSDEDTEMLHRRSPCFLKTIAAGYSHFWRKRESGIFLFLEARKLREVAL